MATRVKVGRGKAPLPDGVITQHELGLRIADRFGVSYEASDLSLCVTGKRVPIEMASHVSQILVISSPIYVARTEEEAARFQAQRDITDRIEAAEARASETSRAAPSSAAPDREKTAPKTAVVRRAREVLDREIAELERIAAGVKSKRAPRHTPVLATKDATERGRARGGVREGRSKPVPS